MGWCFLVNVVEGCGCRTFIHYPVAIFARVLVPGIHYPALQLRGCRLCCCHLIALRVRVGVVEDVDGPLRLAPWNVPQACDEVVHALSFDLVLIAADVTDLWIIRQIYGGQFVEATAETGHGLEILDARQVLDALVFRCNFIHVVLEGQDTWACVFVAVYQVVAEILVRESFLGEMPEAFGGSPVAIPANGYVVDFHRPSFPVGDSHLLRCHLVSLREALVLVVVDVERAVGGGRQVIDEEVHIGPADLVQHAVYVNQHGILRQIDGLQFVAAAVETA